MSVFKLINTLPASMHLHPPPPWLPPTVHYVKLSFISSCLPPRLPLLAPPPPSFIQFLPHSHPFTGSVKSNLPWWRRRQSDVWEAEEQVLFNLGFFCIFCQSSLSVLDHPRSVLKCMHYGNESMSETFVSSAHFSLSLSNCDQPHHLCKWMMSG